MTVHTIQNKRNQPIPSDKKSGATVVPFTIQPNEVFVLDDDEIGPSMADQIQSGLLQISSTVASQDAGSGFVADVDLTSVNSKKVLELQASEEIVPGTVMFRVTEADTVSTDAEVSVGTNGPDYNNIIPSLTLTGLSAVGEAWAFTIDGFRPVVVGPDEIFVKVVTPATAVALKVTAWLFGTGDLL